jgi:hypothetical protein
MSELNLLWCSGNGTGAIYDLVSWNEPISEVLIINMHHPVSFLPDSLLLCHCLIRIASKVDVARVFPCMYRSMIPSNAELGLHNGADFMRSCQDLLQRVKWKEEVQVKVQGDVEGPSAN